MEEYAAQFTAIKEELEEYQGLVITAGYKRFMTVLNGNLVNLRNEMELAETTGIDSLVARESLRGEIAATRLALEFIDRRISDLTEQREMISLEMKEREEDA